MVPPQEVRKPFFKLVVQKLDIGYRSKEKKIFRYLSMVWYERFVDVSS